MTFLQKTYRYELSYLKVHQYSHINIYGFAIELCYRLSWLWLWGKLNHFGLLIFKTKPFLKHHCAITLKKNSFDIRATDRILLWSGPERYPAVHPHGFITVSFNFFIKSSHDMWWQKQNVNLGLTNQLVTNIIYFISIRENVVKHIKLKK